MKTLLTLTLASILAASGCDLAPEPDGDFSQARIYNHATTPLPTIEPTATYLIQPGDSSDVRFDVGGLHPVSIVTETDSIVIYFDIASLNQRQYIRRFPR